MARSSSRTGAGGSGPRRRRTAPPDLEALAQLSGKITALEPQQKDPARRSVYIDGRFVCGLHEETVFLAGLRVGQEVDGPQLLEAVRRDQEKKAWDSAVQLLAAAPRCRREIERKLGRRFPPEVVEAVVERLVSGGWLDDVEFARSYIRSRPTYGERRLVQELVRKGVDRATALEAVRTELGSVDEAEQAREVAAARLKRMSGVDRETAYRRLAGYLGRRGFDFETISRVLGPLVADLPPASRTGAKGRMGGLRRSRWGARPEEE